MKLNIKIEYDYFFCARNCVDQFWKKKQQNQVRTNSRYFNLLDLTFSKNVF